MMRCENCQTPIEQGTRCSDCGGLARFIRIVAEISYEPWTIIVRRDGDRAYLQVRDDNGRCNITSEPMPWSGRKWMLSEHMTETEVVKTALKAVMSAVEHEALERFKYRGLTIFDPHLRVEDLLRMRQSCPLDARA